MEHPEEFGRFPTGPASSWSTRVITHHIVLPLNGGAFFLGVPSMSSPLRQPFSCVPGRRSI